MWTRILAYVSTRNLPYMSPRRRGRKINRKKGRKAEKSAADERGCPQIDYQLSESVSIRVHLQLFFNLKLRLVRHGEFDEGEASAQVELFADVGAVGFDGAIADEKLRRNLFAGFVFGNEF